MIKPRRASFCRSVIRLCILLFVPTAQSVELTFAWQPGMTCEVVDRMSKQTAGRPSESLSIRYILRVSSAEDGELIVTAGEPQLLAGVSPREGREFLAKQI